MSAQRLAALNPTLSRMTMEDSLLLRVESDAGDVDAVTALFRKYGVPEAFLSAVDFVAARQEARERPMRLVIEEG